MKAKTLFILSLLLCASFGTVQAQLRVRPDDEACRHWVDSVMQRLSPEERLGQLFIYTIAPETSKPNRDLLHKVVKQYKVGGLLFSKGELYGHVSLTNEAQELADVPLMITFDGEWGLSMRLKDTPTFPRNMTLGRIQDDTLIYEYGREMARQCRELGVQVNFAPVADVNINPRNPVINTRSFGDDPDQVARKVVAYARGLEDGGILSVCKHFPGHGDTDVDSHKALPMLPFTRARLDSVELVPFRAAIGAGLNGMMVGHLEVPVLESEKGRPASLSRSVVTDLLQEELSFRGLVFTDALAMKGVGGGQTLCLQALKAGHDLLLVPRRIKEEVDAIHAAIKSGELPQAEIDRKCRKVLTYKYLLGLSKRPHVRLSGLEQRLNTEATRDLIQRLKEASQASPSGSAASQSASTAASGRSAAAKAEARIDSIAREGIAKGAYPGCQVVVLKEGKTVYNKVFGTMGDEKQTPITPTSVYDLASLTKTTATLLAVMKLYDQGRLNLTDRLGTLLPWLRGSDKQHITIRQLLLHESGLPYTILFYQVAMDMESIEGTLFSARRTPRHTVRIGSKTWANPSFRYREGLFTSVPTATHRLEVADGMWLDTLFRSDFRRKIVETPLRDRRYRYSCVGFILLQQVVEQVAGEPMDAFLEREFYAPMGLKRTGFLPLHRLPESEIVPSAHDGFLRRQTLRGYVHDESAAFQGGVSGNAGLFSTAEEVARVYQMLLNEGELDGRRYLGAATCRLFTTTTSRISRRALGFDRPDVRNPQRSPCAASVSSTTYGHTGFTGTCAWVDPAHGLVYVFLCNRLLPEVWNTRLMQLDIRRRIQEAIANL